MGKQATSEALQVQRSEHARETNEKSGEIQHVVRQKAGFSCMMQSGSHVREMRVCLAVCSI